MDYSKEHIKSLSKGLSVIVAVNELAPARVSTLVEYTGLPKPTLIRMLNTLVAEGYLLNRPRAEGGGYVPTPKVRLLSSAYAEGTLLTQVAQPILNNLCEVIKWPAEMLVRDGLSMVIEVGNRAVAPIRLKRFEQKRFPLIDSSSGCAFLSALPAPEASEILTSALAHGLPGGVASFSEERALKLIQQARSEGYCFCDYDAPIQGTRVYSIPIVGRSHPIAVLTVITLRDVLDLKKFESDILHHIQEAAGRIAEGIARHPLTD